MLALNARLSVFFVCIAVLFATGCKSDGDFAQISDVNNGASDTQREIRAILDQYIEALQHRDLAALDRIWSDDLTFINPYGDLLNKENRMDNIKNDATAFKSIRLSEIDVRMYGQAAVATFQIAIEAQYSRQESSGNYRVTTVWAHPKGTWQLVAVQMTQVK